MKNKILTFLNAPCLMHDRIILKNLCGFFKHLISRRYVYSRLKSAVNVLVNAQH